MTNDEISKVDSMIDEASAESMIASDPPAFTGLRAGAPAPVRPRAGGRGEAFRAGALFAAGMGLLLWFGARPPRRASRRRTGVRALAESAIVGVCATQALDWLSIALYESQAAGPRTQEDNARGHRHAYETAVARMARGLGASLDEEAIRRWGWRFHKVFGVLGGMGYAALRRRAPAIGAGAGAAFGSAFFVAADEILVPLTGLTPGPGAFPWQTHARGAASHLVYGIAAELASRALDRRS